MPLSKEACMQMAITAWKQQKVKSKLKAAQIFGVPESSLRKRLSGVKPRTETRANSHKLTATEDLLYCFLTVRLDGIVRATSTEDS